MWIIAGTIPDAEFPLFVPDISISKPAEVIAGQLCLCNGQKVAVERGTAMLAAACTMTCSLLGIEPPQLLLVGDVGNGNGSRQLYAWLVENLAKLAPSGIMFHYLFPDVDWHNRVLMAAQDCAKMPLMLADAGFMYVAKMSGYASEYDLFTPDVGELAFLADEKAPHPFYTRGFLLAEDHNIPPLLEKIFAHGQMPRHLLIKGQTDYIVAGKEIIATINSPSVEAMECIGGTGDLVSALVTAFIMQGQSIAEAAVLATKTARQLAKISKPEPDTQVKELLPFLKQVLNLN